MQNNVESFICRMGLIKQLNGFGLGQQLIKNPGKLDNQTSAITLLNIAYNFIDRDTIKGRAMGIIFGIALAVTQELMLKEENKLIERLNVHRLGG